MTEFRFCPIDTHKKFEEALEYVADSAGMLALRLCGERLPVSIVKLFAHDEKEYSFLESLVRQHGQRSEVSSGMSFYVDVSTGLTIMGTGITLLGVRKPDPTKSQIGCGDYEIPDFPNFAERVLKEQPEYAQPVENAHGLGMVELHHPDFDVLGYIVSSEG